MAVTTDGAVSAMDVLTVVNHVNAGMEPLHLAGGPATGPFTDVNGDGTTSAADALAVINYLNSHSAGGGGEGEGESTSLNADGQGQDDLFAMLATDAATAKRRI
jgi:Dockerin type I domain